MATPRRRGRRFRHATVLCCDSPVLSRRGACRSVPGGGFTARSSLLRAGSGRTGGVSPAALAFPTPASRPPGHGVPSRERRCSLGHRAPARSDRRRGARRPRARPRRRLGLPDHADGGGYHGPLAYRQGKPCAPTWRPRAGLYPIVTSGYRSDAEQARLFVAKPNPYLFPRCRAAFRRCAPASRGRERRPARRDPRARFPLRRRAESQAARLLLARKQ
jgi:hypothetical protein